MAAAIIYLEKHSALSLQCQLRQKLVEAILSGALPARKRLPSSRKLAEQLKISRNTVLLAYQQLMDEGYLVSRERSGIFVNERIFDGKVELASAEELNSNKRNRWQHAFVRTGRNDSEFRVPLDWHRYPYPFLDNLFDTSLFPVHEWREASRLALGVREVNEWASFATDADDPQLLEEIRTKLLPSRGINANQSQILIVSSEQQALYLLCHLLVDSEKTVAIEEPGNPVFRQLVQNQRGKIHYQPVDDAGMQVDKSLANCNLVYVTPSHQLPTNATMPLVRRQALLREAARHNALIIEDDASLEHNFLGPPLPALRAIDRDDRVIYLSSLSKVLSPGLRLSYLVGPAEIINEARALRRILSGYPPRNNQRAMAYFLSLGHYDAFIRKLDNTLKSRWMALRDALNYNLHALAETIPAPGGTAYWVKVHDDIDVQELAVHAAREGILIEPIDHYYGTGHAPKNTFRLGITSLPKEKIKEGIRILAKLLRSLALPVTSPAPDIQLDYVSGDKLRSALANAALISSTVYGDPYTIDFNPNGEIVGRCGYQDEDCDTGRWWVEGDLLCRQWQEWVYGQRQQFRVVLLGNRIQWYNLDGELIVNGVLHAR